MSGTVLIVPWAVMAYGGSLNAEWTRFQLCQECLEGRAG